MTVSVRNAERTTRARKGMNFPKWTGGDLPQYAQDMTAEQVEAVVRWHEKLSMKDLRQIRDIHMDQSRLAKEQGMPDVQKSEDYKTDIVTDAIWRKEYGVPLPGRHSHQP